MSFVEKDKPRELYAIYKGIKCRGDIRLVTGDDDIRRLCMIIGAIDDYSNEFAIMLCSNEVECGADCDFVIEPHETGLPYKLIVETDLVGMVYRHQLGPRIGGVSGKIFQRLKPIHEGGRYAAGIPCRDARDGRWQWKLDELSELDKLTAQFWRDWLEREGPYDMDDPQ
jgi:hypothetical protein